MFVTKFNFKPIEQPLYDDTEVVETAGYVPREKTIENLLLCGQRLIESRMEEYDGDSVEEAEKNAPVTRVNNLDIIDSVALVEQLCSQTEGAGETSTVVGDSMSVNENSEGDKPSESPTEGR